MTRTIRAPIYAMYAVAWIAIVALAVLAAPDAEWTLAPAVVLAVLAVVSDLLRIEAPSHRIFISASFLAIIAGAVFLGALPAAVIAVIAIVAGWLRERYSTNYLVLNATAYALFPLAAGTAFHEVVDALAITATVPSYYLSVFALFIVGLLFNFALIGAYTAWEERSSFRTVLTEILVPILPSEFASSLMAVAIALAYVELGLPALVMFALVILVFQYLIQALLVSQERAAELERRAGELAGFQVALLSALLRTLDLRDHMTARHSAAVARYSRELAAAAGLDEEQQELVHTAGLLHDIGKFVLADRVIKAPPGALTAEDRRAIEQHPYEGARIVSQIDGYTPIGEIILAHHERVDGRGYPGGLAGDAIPELARILAIADAYDAMTAHDSYREPLGYSEAVSELRRVAGSQLDGRLVEVFIKLLEQRDLDHRVGADADFEAELALDQRIREYVGSTTDRPQVS